MNTDKIEEALVAHWGERCTDFRPGCPCCAAWQQFDRLQGNIQWLHNVNVPNPEDFAAIREFALAMRRKMMWTAKNGRSGWQECSVEDLRKMMTEAVDKGDPVDIANFCMMLWQLGARGNV